MLPPATVAAKYAALAAETEAFKSTAPYVAALAQARALGGAPTAAPSSAAPAPAAAVAVAVGPAVTVDIAADGLIASLRSLFTDAMLRAVPMTGTISDV